MDQAAVQVGLIGYGVVLINLLGWPPRRMKGSSWPGNAFQTSSAPRTDYRFDESVMWGDY